MPISGQANPGVVARTKEKLWNFFEGPWFWGGAALILGAIAANISLLAVFFIAFIPIAVGVVRCHFFQGRAIRWQFVLNGAVLVVVASFFLVGWKVSPKPKEPPSAKEIATEIVKRIPPATTSVPPRQATTSPPLSGASLASQIAAEVEVQLAARQQQVPPITNEELRREVAEYTGRLRGMQDQLNQAWQMTMKPLNMQPGAEERNRVFWNLYSQEQHEFNDSYKEHGVALRDTLIKRLHITGPPLSTILDDKEIVTPERGRSFDELADYLDSLAKQLPYP